VKSLFFTIALLDRDEIKYFNCYFDDDIYLDKDFQLNTMRLTQDDDIDSDEEVINKSLK